MNTSDFAREAIAAADNAPAETPSAPASSNAGDYADIASQEFDHYVDGDPESVSRRAAAAAMVTLDKRPFVTVGGGLVRRQHEPSSRTNQHAREAVDFSELGFQANAADRRALALHDFAADVNKSTTTGTLDSRGVRLAPGSDAWRKTADDILDEVIAMGRKNR